MGIQTGLESACRSPVGLEKSALTLWYADEKGKFLALCPKCRRWIAYNTFDTAYKELELSNQKACQGCRAKISFEKNPGVIGIFLDFWSRTGSFPDSPSWLEAIPSHLLTLWQAEISTSLKADK